jgi:hypothetical protein
VMRFGGFSLVPTRFSIRVFMVRLMRFAFIP